MYRHRYGRLFVEDKLVDQLNFEKRKAYPERIEVMKKEGRHLVGSKLKEKNIAKHMEDPLFIEARRTRKVFHKNEKASWCYMASGKCRSNAVRSTAKMDNTCSVKHEYSKLLSKFKGCLLYTSDAADE
eukprot:TRINITY_DN406_c0_g1_i7.p1 TRINITY_DN406_c0_g1~~TRINITY_DN406_c0_g1_i7.p1  ORF type:complete len:128 (+),score=30.71 TRINITY_DN406_c0_g1_i7:157-540(+)